MLEFLQANSSLPNLHPAIIHFPIALALTAWLLRLVQVARPGLWKSRESANLLGVLAALGAGAAWLSGRQAADAAGSLSAAAELALARHSDLAGWAAGLLAAAAVVPLIWVLARHRGQRLQAWLNLVALTVAVGVVGWTADLGGALVFEHGVGVEKAAAPAAVRSVAETTPTAIVAFPGDKSDWEYTPGESLQLSVDGTGLVAIAGQWGDSVVEVEIDPADFEGTLTLVHRYTGPQEWEGFQFATNGAVRLVRQTSAGLDIRAKSSLFFPSETFTMRSAAVSGHFKGLVDGDVVVHGHGESGSVGQAGLLINGTGNLSVTALNASSATEH